MEPFGTRSCLFPPTCHKAASEMGCSVLGLLNQGVNHGSDGATEVLGAGAQVKRREAEGAGAEKAEGHLTALFHHPERARDKVEPGSS